MGKQYFLRLLLLLLLLLVSLQSFHDGFVDETRSSDFLVHHHIRQKSLFSLGKFLCSGCNHLLFFFLFFDNSNGCGSGCMSKSRFNVINRNDGNVEQ